MTESSPCWLQEISFLERAPEERRTGCRREYRRPLVHCNDDRFAPPVELKSLCYECASELKAETQYAASLLDRVFLAVLLYVDERNVAAAIFRLYGDDVLFVICPGLQLERVSVA